VTVSDFSSAVSEAYGVDIDTLEVRYSGVWTASMFSLGPSTTLTGVPTADQAKAAAVAWINGNGFVRIGAWTGCNDDENGYRALIARELV
jgi:hypothetical protein